MLGEAKVLGGYRNSPENSDLQPGLRTDVLNKDKTTLLIPNKLHLCSRSMTGGRSENQ